MTWGRVGQSRTAHLFRASGVSVCGSYNADLADVRADDAPRCRACESALTGLHARAQRQTDLYADALRSRCGLGADLEPPRGVRTA